MIDSDPIAGVVAVLAACAVFVATVKLGDCVARWRRGRRRPRWTAPFAADPFARAGVLTAADMNAAVRADLAGTPVPVPAPAFAGTDVGAAPSPGCGAGETHTVRFDVDPFDAQQVAAASVWCEADVWAVDFGSHYKTKWFAPPPPYGVQYRVVRDAWSEDHSTRSVFEWAASPPAPWSEERTDGAR